MKINGKTVPVQFLEREWARLNQMRQQDPELARMDEMALRRLTESNVVGQILLNDHTQGANAKVSAKKVDDRLDQMIKDAGNEKRFMRKFNLKKNQLPEFKKSIEGSIRHEEFIKGLMDKVEEPTEDEAFAFYQKNAQYFGQPEMVHAAHIVKHTNDGTPREEAEKAINEVKAELDGGRDFDELCDEFSDCKGEKGDLGWFPKGQMVERFEDVVFAMKPGEVSDIFETEFGFHIAKLIDKKAGNVTPFDEVKADIQKRLWEQKRHEAIDGFVEELRAKAKVEM